MRQPRAANGWARPASAGHASSSLAKISRPRLPRVFPRTRLFARLDAARERRVIWITAPPGAGKTTLVASWLQERELPCLWYRVDEGDADVATFFYYLGIAANDAAPGRPPLPLLTPEYLGGLGIFSRRWFRELCGGVEPPFTLVFDDYQQAPLEAPLHEAFGAGVAELPEGVNAIFVSRSAPPVPLARQRANGEMALVSGEELRLTLEESKGLAALGEAGRRAPGEIEELHARTDGWTAGLVLLLARRGVEAGDPPRCGRATQEVFDYFAGEVFDRVDPRTRKLLLETALLPKATAAMAEGLTGLPEAGRICEALAQGAWFTTRDDESDPFFAYHPLFREFLLARGKKALAPERARELRCAGARMLEASGHAEEAVEVWREAGRWDEIARIVLSRAPEMLAAGRGSTVSRWIAGLPEALRDRDPWLLYWFGLAALPFDPPAAQRSLERCYELLRGSVDAAALYTVWSAVAGSYALAWDCFAPLDRWIAEWDDLRRRCPEFPSPEVEERAATTIFAALAFRRPDHPELPRWRDRCIEIVRSGADLRQRTTAAMALVHHFAWSGDHRDMEPAVAPLLPALRGTRDPALAITGLLVRANVAWLHAGDVRRALAEFQRSMDEARRSGVTVWWFMQNAHVGTCAALLGDAEAAERWWREGSEAHRPVSGLQAAFQHFVEAAIALRRGEARRAAGAAEIASKLARGAGGHFAELMVGAVLADALTDAGEMEAAAERLEDMRRLAASTRCGFGEYFHLLGAARLELKRGRTAAALPHLRRGMALGASRGIWIHASFGPSEMASVCAAALEHGIEVEYVRELIRRRELLPPDGAVLHEAWPHPIEVRTLGGFELRREGHPVRSAGKTQRKPLELLKALVAFGGAGVHEEWLTDALWPDADGDAARHALDMALHRLRRLLGTDEAVVHRDRTLGIDLRRCWVDALALERALARALTAAECTGSAGGAGIAREAEAIAMLYRGPFLPADLAAPWSGATRERLRSKLMRFVAAAERAPAAEPGAPARALRARCVEADAALRAASHDS